MTAWRIRLASPEITDADRAAVLRVLHTPVLSRGPEGTALEEEFSRRLAGLPAALVSNGTAGLYLALRALGIRGGDVITPSFGFIGTLHAIRLAGARPRFADISPETLCVTRETIEEAWTTSVRAILPVHVFGTPPPMDAIARLARERNVALIEDACEALGAVAQDRPAGTHGDAAVFAFYANKQLTTGEGGLVVARERSTIDRIQSMRNQGRGEREFDFVGEGFNFRLTEMQAALGRSQLARLDRMLAKREAIAAGYARRLARIPGICALPSVREGDRRSWFVYPVFVEEPEWRDPVRKILAAAGIETAPYFPALHGFEGFREPALRGSGLAVTSAVAARSFALPFHTALTERDLDEVSGMLERGLAAAGASTCRLTLPTLVGSFA